MRHAPAGGSRPRPQLRGVKPPSGFSPSKAPRVDRWDCGVRWVTGWPGPPLNHQSNVWVVGSEQGTVQVPTHRLWNWKNSKHWVLESHTKCTLLCSMPVRILHAGDAGVPGEDGECRDKPGGGGRRAGLFLCSEVHFNWLSFMGAPGSRGAVDSSRGLQAGELSPELRETGNPLQRSYPVMLARSEFCQQFSPLRFLLHLAR